MAKFKASPENKEIARKANIVGSIKNASYFIHDNKTYVAVINKVARLYAVRLIHYEYNESTKELKIIAVKRFPNLFGFFSTKEEAYEQVGAIKSSSELINQCVYVYETQEDDVENILVFGRTGNGKSALANVISDTDKFGESEKSTSETENYQIQNFEWEGMKYRVIDTIGVGDTKLGNDDVLYKIGEAIHFMKKGIKQVLVVVGRRYTKEETDAFDLLKSAIFENNITGYITIVRTHFDNFKNPEKCDKDKEDLKKENKKLSKIIESCNEIVYVNNPSLNIDDEEQKAMNGKIRKDSRQILLTHLNSCQGSYKLNNWDDICVKINDFMNAKQWHKTQNTSNLIIKNELREIKKEIVKEVGNQLNQLERTNSEAQIKAGAEINSIGKLHIDARFKNCCLIS